MNANDTAAEAPYRLDEIEGILREAGLPYSRIGNHLRAELYALDAFYGIAYIVAAEEVFSFAGSQGEVEYARSQLWEHVCGKDHFEYSPKKNLYLFVVGPSELIDQPEYLVARAHIVNDDRNYAMKRVVTPAQAQLLLQNPFQPLVGAARAAERPELHLVREPYEQLGTTPEQLEASAGLTVGPILDYREAERRYDSPALVSRGDEFTDEVWDHVEVIFRRLMGLDYGLRRTVLGLCVTHRGNPHGAFMWQASRGERMAFAFAQFLAEAAKDVKPGLCLGVHDVLAAFDTLRQLVALDLLRDFAVATGASIQLRSAKQDFKRLAEAKFNLLKALPA
ncbi:MULTISPECIES: hypothetical protein [unclassified Variovorax]|uniref:hypothetical protein n=1 Tax=unclassified Variovorax TaxID=663243 RepID=UPI00076DED91|nr:MULTISPECIES: hypothetical protein [unclassified Variovorax]KWT98079.1 hypothetical protein APY03_0750 [Variovorax sp. WDL1]PNG50447.1 hypothetical protein CHC06_06071 [Variovorax sp. B2]PNG51320.1 hypothetical protein CHC07_05977 [Variovorax sp. B4]VTU43269.1 hypothetical protein H6P1_00403 [Variovorax sp. PBL-H6]VTU43329.1 hypothetical protein SRS16P1_00502 [Variovorax sp. SRS16]